MLKAEGLSSIATSINVSEVEPDLCTYEALLRLLALMDINVNHVMNVVVVTGFRRVYQEPRDSSRLRQQRRTSPASLRP